MCTEGPRNDSRLVYRVNIHVPHFTCIGQMRVIEFLRFLLFIIVT